MNNDFFTDEELDQMFDEQQQQVAPPPHPMVPAQQAYPQPEPVPLYSLALANVPAPQPQQPVAPQQPQQDEGLLMKKWGPLPVWAWSLIGIGVAGTGYFGYKTLTKNGSSKSDGDDDSGGPKIGEIISKAFSAGPSDSSGGGGWEPSRSRFAEQLNRYFVRKGQSQHVKVFHDAEDAQKSGMKHVSPLINVQVKHGTVKLDQPLTRFCRREGLNPLPHPDGSIGLYPHSSKRGKEWEEYIDALRDDGQQI